MGAGGRLCCRVACSPFETRRTRFSRQSAQCRPSLGAWCRKSLEPVTTGVRGLTILAGNRRDFEGSWTIFGGGVTILCGGVTIFGGGVTTFGRGVTTFGGRISTLSD